MRHERSIQLIPDGLDDDPALRRQAEAMTPESLLQHDLLSGRCALCGHEGRIDIPDLQRRWPRTSMVKLEGMLRCRHCRNRGGGKFIARRVSRD